MTPRLLSVSLGMIGYSLVFASPQAWSQVETPEPLDERLAIQSFVTEPDLVTPTGIAVDSSGNVFVIECHTHFRPEDYEGPEADRIRVFIDTNGDGKSDEAKTFFEGTTATMNLSVAPDGSLLVATRAEIFRLRDTDGDLVADERTELAHLETEGNYPHNGLSGFAYDLLGRIYFGFGENLGEPYELIAANGDRIAGGGEGGSVFRIQPDGSGLVRWATGFWNPYHMATDDFGRLFVVDNDPDWRPPCRLLHIVRGGDYGFRFNLGRKGTHPFIAWFGDEPDRLGMVAGTGEAPSGMVSYRSTDLPSEYQGRLLCTSWGLHSIESYTLQRRGATWVSDAETIVKGNEDFRPVGIATDPEGRLRISDWVKRSYPLHMHGRVWTLGSADSLAAGRDGGANPDEFPGPMSMLSQSGDRGQVHLAVSRLLQGSIDVRPILTDFVLAPEETGYWRKAVILSQWYQTDGATEELKQLVRQVIRGTKSQDLLVATAQLGPALDIGLSDAMTLRKDLTQQPEALADWVRYGATEEDRGVLQTLLESDDAWVQQAAISRLADLANVEELVPSPSDSVRKRVALATALERMNSDEARGILPMLLDDEAAEVRWVALRWIGERRLKELNEAVDQALENDQLQTRELEAILATQELLGGRAGQAFEQEQAKTLNQLIQDNSKSGEQSAAIALRMLVDLTIRVKLDPLPDALKLESLQPLTSSNQNQLALMAIRAIRTLHAEPAALLLLEKIAANKELPTNVRLAAIAGIVNVDALLTLSDDDNEEIASEAMRFLRGLELNANAKARLREIAAENSDRGDLTEMLLVGVAPNRPNDDDLAGWNAWLNDQAEGDAEVGRRIFESRLGRCASCHQVQGQGGLIGPDLSQAGQMSRERLLESIVQPSREVAPRFTAWLIETDDGQTQMGILQTERGADQFYVDSDGKTFVIHHDSIIDQTASEQSLMPAKLLDGLTDQEIADLMAYLQGLRE